MLSLAVSSMFFHEYPVDEIFSSVEEAGLTGLEFWVETPHFWLRGHPLHELKAAVRAHPRLSPLTLHAPALDLNPCSINPRVAAASQQYAVEAVALAGAVGADVVTVHPGRRTARRPPSRYDYAHFRTYLARLRQASAETGVRVAIENMEPKVNSLLCTPEGMRETLDAHPWLWFTLDVAHAMTVSGAEVARYLETCGDRIANVHLSMVAEGQRHLPVAGREEACEVVRALRDAGYRGPLTLEIEDQVFAHPLSLEEKVMVLRDEHRYITCCLS
ncbi:sugar phosphate isomerase/epimerase [Methanofollis sp. W23]|uniref:sugar phosphate isomerase/epimerase family protein n=1 Tax=Methanofollis sp. W23 TaxID=2817849 RepID=UPI001AEB2276|nr:sugar phosphate isomerase/epimerase family protein [Methanofollis sp. W23]MBP2145948.1 sugar phosphate isomerase/epimerase [Methanofollis sp. W23]